MTKNKRYSKNEFRYNYYTNHTNYIFEEDGNNYHSLGLTHQRKTFDNRNNKWRKNLPLFNNPNKKDNSKSYVRYGVITQNRKTFSNSVDNRFMFSENDMPKVKSIVRKYKTVRHKQ